MGYVVTEHGDGTRSWTDAAGRYHFEIDLPATEVDPEDPNDPQPEDDPAEPHAPPEED